MSTQTFHLYICNNKANLGQTTSGSRVRKCSRAREPITERLAFLGSPNLANLILRNTMSLNKAWIQPLISASEKTNRDDRDFLLWPCYSEKRISIHTLSEHLGETRRGRRRVSRLHTGRRGGHWVLPEDLFLSNEERRWQLLTLCSQRSMDEVRSSTSSFFPS